MKDFDLLHPERWPFLLVPVLILVLGWLLARRRRRDLHRFGDVRDHPILLADAGPVRRRTQLVLEVVGLLLIAIAALEPSLGYALTRVERRGIELVICLDTSRSMLATDLPPSRLERAKQHLRGMLAELQGDRVALIAFAGDAKIVCPLTHDLAAFEGLLATVSETTTRRGGTNLGEALRSALSILPADQETSQAIIILSDGEDLEGQGQHEALRARSRGIRVHTIGYGSPRGAKIPDGNGGFLVDEHHNEVISRMDAQGLRTLAESCGGEFLPADAVLNPVVELLEKRIRVMHKRRFENLEKKRARSRFQWALLPGFVLLLLAFLDPGRRRALPTS